MGTADSFSHFRVIRQNLSDFDIAHLSCLEQLMETLAQAIESIDLIPALARKSISLKKAIFETKVDSGTLYWRKTPIVQDEVLQSIDVPLAIYHLDGTWNCQGQCGSTHLLNFVVCLNNRETIGTNFLKLEIANRLSLDEVSDDIVSVGILITFHRDLLDYGGWDPAYADSYEYRQAYKKIYHSALTGRFLTLEIAIT